jgi:hypothetical protein
MCEGLEHPNWYESFGFAKFANHLEDKYVDMDYEFACCMMIQQRKVVTSSHLPIVCWSYCHSIFIGV